jgi:hypothetical protein
MVPNSAAASGSVVPAPPSYWETYKNVFDYSTAVGNDKVTTLEGLGTVQKLMSGITGRGWSGYPILAFPEVPNVGIILMNSECAIIPTDA